MTKPDYISLKNWVVAGLLSVTGLVAATTFLAPSQAAASSDLRSATITRKNYNEAMSSIDQQIKQEESDSSIRPECRTYTKTHGKRAAKAVLMIHGISGCSNVYQKLADEFYNQGYNVYVPRVPKHGYTDNKRHGEISTKDIANFMKTSAQQVSGLGDELGIVGHSGGGDMATWLAQYGNGFFTNVLLLAPFYEPAASQAPKWQLPVLRTLYGYNILPDKFSPSGLSYRALGKYLIVKQNFKKDLAAPGLKRVATVTSENDDAVDNGLAVSIPQRMAQANNASFQHYNLPKRLNIGHNMVGSTDGGMATYHQAVYTQYLNLYEGRQTAEI